MAPGAISKFGLPMFKPEGLSKANVMLKKVLVTLLGFFDTPRSDSVPGELPPRCASSLNSQTLKSRSWPWIFLSLGLKTLTSSLRLLP